jgi:hypothetical protein
MKAKPYCKYPGEFGYSTPLELTGKCKRVYTNQYELVYSQVQRRIFGIPIWKSWILKSDIIWKEVPKVEYYDCEPVNQQ